MSDVQATAAIELRADDAAAVTDRLIGLALIAGAPTVFWTAVVCLAAWAFGSPLSTPLAGGFAALVFGFLSCIWAGFTIADRAGIDGA